ncbi:hypothetical protein [uncultured Abyssibacter sp.]|uniref:hypothetical protein n=1 Tax=uncultured Abyssibacter sp. TaxID=2320202 RepID=UPI0032B1E3DB
MSALTQRVLDAQDACRSALGENDPLAGRDAWHRYDEIVRQVEWSGVPPQALRAVLDRHLELEAEARRVRNRLAEHRQTVSRRQDADRAYRSHQSGPDRD